MLTEEKQKLGEGEREEKMGRETRTKRKKQKKEDLSSIHKVNNMKI